VGLASSGFSIVLSLFNEGSIIHVALRASMELASVGLTSPT